MNNLKQKAKRKKVYKTRLEYWEEGNKQTDKSLESLKDEGFFFKNIIYPINKFAKPILDLAIRPIIYLDIKYSQEKGGYVLR